MSEPQPGGAVDAVSAADRFTAFFSHVPLAALLIGLPEGQILQGNAHVSSVLGRDPAPGDTLFDLLDPGTDPDVLDAVTRAVAGDSPETRVPVQLRRDGAISLQVELVMATLPADGRASSVATCLFIDHVERDRHERWAARLFDLSLDMVGTSTLDGYFIDINPAWRSALGWTREELTSMPYIDLVHPDDVEATTAAATSLLTQRAVTANFENRYRTRDGSYRWLLWSVCHDTEDNLLYFVAKDVTERREADELLRATVRDLARSNRDLEQFAYVASHDLSEPLRSVGGYVQLLASRYRGQLDSNADDFIGFAVDGVNRMQDLIRDLLSYSRAGANLRIADVDCNELVASVVSEARRINSDATFDVASLPTVSTDATALRQVFANLVSNGLKFVPEGRPPVITVSAERIDDTWTFTVADNGIGISERHLDRIFGMFQRLHTRTAYSGTGIGLAICQRVVERLGGRISVRSTVDVGSQFDFTLPATPKEDQ